MDQWDQDFVDAEVEGSFQCVSLLCFSFFGGMNARITLQICVREPRLRFLSGGVPCSSE